MNRSIFIAILLATAATLWIVSGQFGSNENPIAAQKTPVDLSAADRLPQVRVRHQRAEPRMTQTLLRGRTEAVRMIDIKAETHGRVIELAIERGDRVERGQVLARLAAEDRPAKLAQAKALKEQRRIEYEAAKKLSQKGFRAETQLAASRAELEAAEAAVTVAEVALENTVIHAPFDGIIDSRQAEMGEFIEVGDHIARIVDLDPILIVAQVNERELGTLELGQRGSARLATGAAVDGRLRFISTVADPTTRTFRVELEVANADLMVADGLTAELRLPQTSVPAHHVSPAILALTDEGVVGVKVLGPGDKVAFKPVRILDSDETGVWLADLPEDVILITVGQEFVQDGQVVVPIDETTLQPLVRDLSS
jgi:multidrug efflux system membrane fusion protein